MKNIFKTLLTCTLLLSMNALNAQSLYYGFGTGYGHSAAPNLFSAYDYEDISGTETSTLKKGNGSFGRGAQLNVFAGLPIGNGISAELAAAYLYGFTSKSSSNSQGSGSFSYSSDDQIRSRTFRLMPSLKFQMGSGKTTPYMKAGAVIGFGSKLIMESSGSSSSQFGGNSSNTMKMEFTGRTSLGFSGALGLQFELSKKLHFFTEVHMITHSWAPKRSVITEYTNNGADMLPSMDTNEKETEYLNKYTESDDPNAPDKELKYFMPLSSIGLQLGLVLNL